MFSALFLALFVELPFGSLWRTYMDGWFLKEGRARIEDVGAAGARVKSVLS